ncbi:hypothetical protein WR25_05774 isoform A [Diploscapter pachys]|uniref:Small ribosomal subunit protein uS10m n=1 Tax=Diploscapter pachys TaxID=2018661 RepID=A0A2A2M0U6_9BILA|nr:hypothetical protein WR25_05774 isoform A [Diploscapter pachys]
MLKAGSSLVTRLILPDACSASFSNLPTTATPTRFLRTIASVKAQPQVQVVLPDQLFSRIELEYRGHDKEVLKSYTKFLSSVCEHLGIERGKTKVLPYIRWVQYALRSKFAHKKYKLHYETRTHITQFEVLNLTGSSASTFLEYIQRNIPEGVGMKIEYDELHPLPLTVKLEEGRREEKNK